jgi:hypothetical protein
MTKERKSEKREVKLPNAICFFDLLKSDYGSQKIFLKSKKK